jgi:hypothetical protein
LDDCFEEEEEVKGLVEGKEHRLKRAKLDSP